MVRGDTILEPILTHHVFCNDHSSTGTLKCHCSQYGVVVLEGRPIPYKRVLKKVFTLTMTIVRSCMKMCCKMGYCGRTDRYMTTIRKK